jgi:hypothetical protein
VESKLQSVGFNGNVLIPILDPIYSDEEFNFSFTLRLETLAFAHFVNYFFEADGMPLMNKFSDLFALG